METYRILVLPDGTLRCIYNDALRPLLAQAKEVLEGVSPNALREGQATIQRASYVEPSGPGATWEADMSPVGGPVLPACERRSEALEREEVWLNEHLSGLEGLDG